MHIQKDTDTQHTLHIMDTDRHTHTHTHYRYTQTNQLTHLTVLETSDILTAKTGLFEWQISSTKTLHQLIPQHYCLLQWLLTDLAGCRIS